MGNGNIQVVVHAGYRQKMFQITNLLYYIQKKMIFVKCLFQTNKNYIKGVDIMLVLIDTTRLIL